MQVEKNKATVRRFIEAMNNREFAILDQLLAPNVVRHCQATPGIQVRSLDDFKEFLQMDFRRKQKRFDAHAFTSNNGVGAPKVSIAELGPLHREHVAVVLHIRFFNWFEVCGCEAIENDIPVHRLELD